MALFRTFSMKGTNQCILLLGTSTKEENKISSTSCRRLVKKNAIQRSLCIALLPSLAKFKKNKNSVSFQILISFPYFLSSFFVRKNILFSLQQFFISFYISFVFVCIFLSENTCIDMPMFLLQPL
jgi:hypothetical protein